MLATAMEFAMAGRQLAPLILSDEERTELESLASRRKTAQALALRARIVLACAEGAQNKDVAAKLSLDSATVGNGAAVLHSIELTACATTPVPARHARSMIPA
jgi:DNA-binding NarL/FixJ family response regulator